MTDPRGPSRIAVIASGSGSEVEVSLNSAANVTAALLKRFDFVEIFRFDDHLTKHLKSFRPDVVMPMAHGDGETGELQRLLEELEIAYVGSGPLSCAMSWDKARSNAAVKELLQNSDQYASSGAQNFSASVPDYVEINCDDLVSRLVADFCSTLNPWDPLVSKPSRQGSSVGIEFFVHPSASLFTKAEVVSRLEGFNTQREREVAIVDGVYRALTLGGSAILQRVVQGMEITVAVIEEAGVPRAFPVIEIATPKGYWFDYEQKYKMGASTHIIPARLPHQWLTFCQKLAVDIHQTLDSRDLSRVDFIVEKPSDSSEPSNVCFLELNSLPGFNVTSLYPEAAAADGYSLDRLLQMLVMQAFMRRSSN